MPTNDFKAFGTGVGANVMTQADYVIAIWLAGGFQAGLAQSPQLNKVWRQASFMAAVLAQMIVDKTNADLLDDGDLAGAEAKLLAAIAVASVVRPARLVTSSAALNILTTDYAIGLNRTVALAAQQANLPAVTNANIGQEFVIEDLVGNLAAYPVTVVPAAGTIAGRANYVMNEDRQGAGFRYYGTDLWGVRT